VASDSGSEDAPFGAPSRGVEFALDSFEIGDGRLVVAGRWYGVTGRRFMRPVLQADGQRRLIALLDHKPWSAEEGAQWLAAFPDDGYVGASRLQVAPDIAVELPAAGPEAGDGKPRPARLARTPIRRSTLEAEPASAEELPAAAPRRAGHEAQDAHRTAEIEAERDAALAEIEAIRHKQDEARAAADRLRAELDQARREAERLRGELDHTRTDADRLRTELSHVRADVNTLRPGHDDAQVKAERLEADVARLRTEAHRAIAERNAAQMELGRLRRSPSSHAYIAPRPMAFRELEPGPSWRIRAVAAALVLAAIAVLVQLLFGVL
jgi:hypothetical protein